MVSLSFESGSPSAPALSSLKIQTVPFLLTFQPGAPGGIATHASKEPMLTIRQIA